MQFTDYAVLVVLFVVLWAVGRSMSESFAWSCRRRYEEWGWEKRMEGERRLEEIRHSHALQQLRIGRKIRYEYENGVLRKRVAADGDPD